MIFDTQYHFFISCQFSLRVNPPPTLPCTFPPRPFVILLLSVPSPCCLIIIPHMLQYIPCPPPHAPARVPIPPLPPPCPVSSCVRSARSEERSLQEAGSRMLAFVTMTLPALQDWGFRDMGQRWALSLMCLQSLRFAWLGICFRVRSLKIGESWRELWGAGFSHGGL